MSSMKGGVGGVDVVFEVGVQQLVGFGFGAVAGHQVQLKALGVLLGPGPDRPGLLPFHPHGGHRIFLLRPRPYCLRLLPVRAVGGRSGVRLCRRSHVRCAHSLLGRRHLARQLHQHPHRGAVPQHVGVPDIGWGAVRHRLRHRPARQVVRQLTLPGPWLAHHSWQCLPPTTLERPPPGASRPRGHPEYLRDLSVRPNPPGLQRRDHPQPHILLRGRCSATAYPHPRSHATNEQETHQFRRWSLRASATSSGRRWSTLAQPITRRVVMSMTVARYSPGAEPLILDVRQTESSPIQLATVNTPG